MIESAIDSGMFDGGKTPSGSGPGSHANSSRSSSPSATRQPITPHQSSPPRSPPTRSPVPQHRSTAAPTTPSENEPAVRRICQCQVPECAKDLTREKEYFKRYRVCRVHSNARRVVLHGMTQRFCQQCSQFHTLDRFDDIKRTCREALVDHNVRRKRRAATTQPGTGAASGPTSQYLSALAAAEAHMAAGSFTHASWEHTMAARPGTSSGYQPSPLVAAAETAVRAAAAAGAAAETAHVNRFRASSNPAGLQQAQQYFHSPSVPTPGVGSRGGIEGPLHQGLQGASSAGVATCSDLTTSTHRFSGHSSDPGQASNLLERQVATAALLRAGRRAVSQLDMCGLPQQYAPATGTVPYGALDPPGGQPGGDPLGGLRLRSSLGSAPHTPHMSCSSEGSPSASTITGSMGSGSEGAHGSNRQQGAFTAASPAMQQFRAISAGNPLHVGGARPRSPWSPSPPPNYLLDAGTRLASTPAVTRLSPSPLAQPPVPQGSPGGVQQPLMQGALGGTYQPLPSFTSLGVAPGAHDIAADTAVADGAFTHRCGTDSAPVAGFPAEYFANLQLRAHRQSRPLPRSQSQGPPRHPGDHQQQLQQLMEQHKLRQLQQQAQEGVQRLQDYHRQLQFRAENSMAGVGNVAGDMTDLLSTPTVGLWQSTSGVLQPQQALPFPDTIEAAALLMPPLDVSPGHCQTSARAVGGPYHQKFSTRRISAPEHAPTSPTVWPQCAAASFPPPTASMSRPGSLQGQLPTPMVGSVLGPEETAQWWLHGPGSGLGPISPEAAGAAVQPHSAPPQQAIERPAGANYPSPLLQDVATAGTPSPSTDPWEQLFGPAPRLL